MDSNNEMSIFQIEKAIEAILFAAGHPMKYTKIGEVLGLSEKDTILISRNLADKFNSPENEHGFMMLCFDDECQLCTREEFAPYIREALGIRRGGNLSASSLEVLAVIAYNQPVTRSFVDTVRGVDSSYAVNSLLEKNLIEPCGRLDAPGRPMLYKTTEAFLRCFGLNSLSELPEADTLPLNEINKENAAENMQIDFSEQNTKTTSEPESEPEQEEYAEEEIQEEIEGAISSDN